MSSKIILKPNSVRKATINKINKATINKVEASKATNNKVEVRSQVTKIAKENPEKVINVANKQINDVTQSVKSETIINNELTSNAEVTITPAQTITLEDTIILADTTKATSETSKVSQVATLETNPSDTEQAKQISLTEDQAKQESLTIDQTLEVKYIKFTPQEIMFYNKVNGFFRTLEEKKFKHMVDILNGEADISLRLLEWFITKYCDKYRTTKCNKENGESFVIYVGYKAALKTYRKRYFDPFKRNQQERKQKFCYVCKKNTKEYRVNTTLGQLHFFRWLFENNILNYVIKNFDTIKASMEHTNRLEKKRKDEDKKNGVKKIKNKAQHKKFNKSSASSSVEINTHDTSKGKSSLVISFD